MTQDAPPLSSSTARLFEAAEAASLKSHVECLTQLSRGSNQAVPNYIAKPIAGGLAARTTPSHGRKLNRVVGIGMDGPVAEDEIQNIKSLYDDTYMTPTIVVAGEFADRSVRQILRARGYTVFTTAPLHYLPLCADESQEYILENCAGCIGISSPAVGEDERQVFVEASAAGFAPKYPGSELPYAQALSASHRPDTTVYIARINGEIAGTAAMALIGTGFGRVANLYFDSTLPAFQGRGVQMALIRARLADAKRARADYATASTWPVGSSARNFAKAGFRVGYQKEFWTLL